MTGIVLLGAGGHGREVAEILRFGGGLGDDETLLGFVDDDPALQGEQPDGLPVLGDWSWFESVDRADIRVICAVGAPRVARTLVKRAETLGLPFARAISSLAYVSPLAHVGQGAVIFPYTSIHTGARIGNHVIVNVGATVSHDTVIGPFCNINPGAHIAGRVTIGDGCYVGMGTNIIQQRTVGRGTVLGAGAVVVEDIGPDVVAVGIPARVIKGINKEVDHGYNRDLVRP